MKSKNKKRSLFLVLFALGISTSVVTACKAPGSSVQIGRSGDQEPKGPKPKEDEKPSDSLDKIKFVTSDPKAGNNTQKLAKPQDGDLPRKISNNIIYSDQKIRYVAIGDSITAGFDGTLPKDYKGQLEANNSVSGLSYPAFLARMLNQNNRVESFNNYAISGATTLDWIKFLNFELDNKRFGTNPSVIFSSLNNKRQQIINELQNSNLITFTLGANDFFGLLFDTIGDAESLDLIKNFFDNKPILGDAIKFVNRLFQKALPEMRKRLIAFAKQLKELAPKANINIVSYPMPLLMLFNVLNEYINTNLIGNLGSLKVLDLLQEILNDLLKEVAINSDVNYVNTYNNEFWNENAKDLSAIFFDIHPGTKGYKKMAMDLYLKITKPNLNQKYYDNYNFTDQYLKLDANTASYQIQVDNPDQSVLGKSSYEYINTTSDYEYSIDLLRTPLNFMGRLKELAYVFDYYIGDVLDFLTNSSVYEQIDPNGVLKTLLNKTSTKGNTYFANLTSEIFSSQKIAQILANIQIQIDLATKDKNLDFASLKRIVTSNILSLDNLAYVISGIARSELVKFNKDELSKAIKEVIQNILSVFKDPISNLLVNPIHNVLKDYNIQKSDISKIFDNLISSKDFVALISKLIDIFIYNSDEFSDLSNLSQFINAFIADKKNNEELSSLINNNFKYFINNEGVQNLVTNVVYSSLEKANLTKNITKEQLKQATNNGFDLLQELNIEFKIVDNLIANVLNKIAIRGLGNITQVVSEAFVDSFKSFLLNNDYESNIVKVVKILANSKFIASHQDLLSQLLNNLLDSQNISSVSMVLTSAIRSNQTLSKFFNEQDLNNVFKFVLNLTETKQMLLSTVDATLKNYETFKNVQSLNEVILKIISNFNLDLFKTNLVSFLNKIRNSSEFKQFLISSLTNYVSSANIKLTTKDHEFIQSLINDLNPTLDDINILEPVINTFFEHLKEIKNSDNILGDLNGLSDKLLNVIQRKINDPIAFAKKLINKPYIKNNVDFIGTIAKIVYADLNAKGLLVNLVNNNLFTLLENANVSKYLDQDEIKKLFITLINNPETQNIIYSAITVIINDPNLLDKLNDTNDLINTLLVKADVKKLIKNSLKNISIDLFNDISLNKTLAKTLVEISKDSFLAIDKKYQSLIHNVIPSIKHILKSTNKYEQFFSLIFNTLSETNSIDQIASNLFDKFKDFFDFKDLNLYKVILTSPIVLETKDLLKEFLNDFLTKIKSPQFPEFINSLLPESLPYNITKDEIKTTISLIYNNENLHKAFNLAIDLLFNNLDNLKNATSLIQALKVVLNDKTNLQSLGTEIASFVSAVHKDRTIKKVIVNLLQGFLNQPSYSWVLENVNDKETFLNNTYDTLISELTNLNLIKHLFGGLEQFISSDSLDFSSLISFFIKELFKEFAADKLETNLVRIIKAISQNYLTQNKQAILQVFKNIYNHFANDKEKFPTLLSGILPENIKSKIQEYANLSDLADLTTLVLSDNEVKNNIFELVSSILNNSQKLAQINSLSDLIFTALKSIDHTKLKTLLTNIFSKVNTPSWSNSIVKLLAQILENKYPKIYKKSTTEGFIENLIKDYYAIDKIANFNQKIIDYISNAIGNSSHKNLNDLYNDLSINKLTNSIFDDLTTKLDQIIQAFVKSNVITKNKTYFLEVIEFASLELLNNYNLLLEPLNKLLVSEQLIDESKKLTLDQFKNFNEFVQDVIYFDSNVSLIYKTLNFSDQQLKSITNLETLKTALINNLTNAVNIQEYDFIKSIIHSNFLSKEKEFIKHIIEKLIQKFVTKETLTPILTNVSLNLFGSESLNNTLKNALADILVKDDFKAILKTIVNTVLDNLNHLQKATTYNDLVKAIFTIPSLKSQIEQPLVKFIKDAILNDKFKTSFRELLTNLLNNPSFTEYFKGIENKQRIVDNVLDVYNIIDKHLNFSQLIFNTIFDALATYGSQVNITKTANVILNGLQKHLGDSTNQESKVIALIKELANSKLFAENKDDLTKLLSNIINILKTQGTFDNALDALPQSAKSTIAKFIPLNSLKTLFNYILANQHFNSIFNNTVYNFITRINEFKDVASYFDVLKKTLSIIDTNKLETDVNGLINDLLKNSTEVKQAINDFLMQTLTTYGVSVTDAKIKNLITNISNNLDQLVEAADILKPIIDKFFIRIKSASSQTNLTGMLDEFKALTNDVSLIIQSKLKDNPKQFVDKILNLSFLKNDKATLAKVISQLLIGLKNKGVLANIFNQVVDNIEQNTAFLTLVDKQTLKLLGQIALDNTSLNNALTSIVPELINDTNWLNHTNNLFELLKIVLTKAPVKNAIISYLNTFANSLSNNPKVLEIALRLIDNLAKNYQINLNGINKTALVSALLNNLNNYLKDIQLLPNLFTQTLDSITSSINTEHAISRLQDWISSKLNLGSYQTYKKFFIHFENLSNNKNDLKQIFNSVLTNIGQNNELLKSFVNTASQSNVLVKYQIPETDLESVLKAILSDNQILNNFKDLFGASVNNWNAFKSANDFWDLLNRLLQDSSFSNSSANLLKTILNKLLINTNFHNIISKITVNEVKNTKYSQIFDRLSNSENFVKNSFSLVNIFNKNLKLTDNLVDNLILDLKKSKDPLTINSIINSLVKSVNNFISQDNFDLRAAQLFKEVLNNSAFEIAKLDLTVVVENATTILIKDVQLGELVWSLLPSSSRAFITRNFIDKTHFTGVIDDILDPSSIKEVVGEIMVYIINNKSQFANINNLVDIFKIYFNNPNNKQNFQAKIVKILQNGFKKTNAKNAIIAVFDKGIKFFNIRNTSQANKLKRKFADGFGDFLVRQEIFTNALNAVFETVSRANNLKQIPSVIANALSGNLKISEFNTIKKLLKDELIQKNSKLIIDFAFEAISNFINDQNRIRAAIDEFGIVELITASYPDIDKILVKDMLILAINNPDLRQALNTSISDFITRINEYQKNNSWLTALNTLLNAPTETSSKLKDNFYNWIKATLKNPDQRLVKGAAQVLISKLRDSNVMFSFTGQDATMVNNMVGNFFKFIADRNELKGMIDKIYERIRLIDFSKLKRDDPKIVIRAITDGAFHFLLAWDYKTFQLSKIYENIPFLKALIDSLGDDNYVRFINRIFEASDRTKMTGIYGFIKNTLMNGEWEHEKPGKPIDPPKPPVDPGKPITPSPSPTPTPPEAPIDTEEGYGFYQDYSVLTIRDRVADLLRIFYRPIFRQMLVKLSNKTYNINNPKGNPEYHAAYRITALVLWFLKDKAELGGWFWNIGLDAVSMVVNSLSMAFGDARDTYPDKFKQLSNKELEAMGGYSSWYGIRSYNTDFIIGNRASSTRHWNYWSDQLLAYVYYRVGYNDRYTGRANTDILLDSLKDGFLHKR